MSNSDKFGRAVAAFSFPIPVSAMPYIADCVERVYGTGETLLSFDGDSLRVVAPVDGFGPLKRSGKRPPRPASDEMFVRAAELRDGRLKLTVEEAQGAALVIAETMKQWFDLVGGVNYLECEVLASAPNRATDDDNVEYFEDADDSPQFVFTLQRRDGETPHALRMKAEARVAELEAELAQLRGAQEEA